jgi:hypothetical protein
MVGYFSQKPPNHKKEASMLSKLSQHWDVIQGSLFPALQKKEEMSVLTERHKRLVTILELIRVEKCVSASFFGCLGRPEKDRHAICRVFIAKSIYDIPETKFMIELLHIDPTLRRICGFSQKKDIPSEATFSRAFADFAQSDLPSRMHEAFIREHHSDRLLGHISRDATAIEARERVGSKPEEAPKPPKKKRGRPKKGEVREVELTRLEKQRDMSLKQMLIDLPKQCDIGTKKNSKGFKVSWKGYKLHIDTADGDIPISAVLTSASVHDSQVSIPLAEITQSRVTYCYELMDSAYDAAVIRDYTASKGHVGLIDFNHRSPKDERKFEDFEAERYKNRSSAERVNSQLKDNYAGMDFRFRGHDKIRAHLLFGILCIAVEQSLKLIT